ncbi:hypothetical protein DM02DRAFT_624029 [Periconia macrospinosa]|uniref:Uncharacterized protein n=1 Tax=Periconia macrospinosa TaxID=97972 RepID=A0A2V1E7K4_9PLEO|nr:hypothetical protein DM02DRAFT_624029 [Periconia macrospinosa]
MQFFTILFAAVVAAAPTTTHEAPAEATAEPLAARARIIISGGKPELWQDIREYVPGPDVPSMLPKLPPYSKRHDSTRPQNLPYIVAEAGEYRVQVGEITGNALYNSTVAALQDLCPGKISGCEKNRKFEIPGIKFKAPDDLVANTGIIDISVEAQLDRMPKDLLKSDFINIIASILAKQSENQEHCEHIETPCHSHECLPSISVSTMLCNISNSVAVHMMNSSPPVQMTTSLVFRPGTNATVLPVLP